MVELVAWWKIVAIGCKNTFQAACYVTSTMRERAPDINWVKVHRRCWFGRARRAEHAKACSHARPTKKNKNISFSKFDGACVQARETRALHAARYQTWPGASQHHIEFAQENKPGLVARGSVPPNNQMLKLVIPKVEIRNSLMARGSALSNLAS